MPTAGRAPCRAPWRRRWTGSPPASRCGRCSASRSADLPAPQGGRARCLPERGHVVGTRPSAAQGVTVAFNSGLDIEKSYYVATANPAPSYPPLEGEVEADLVVVGGGCTGLSAALHAAERGLKVVLLEGGRIGWGASGRNGGQIIPGLRKGAVGLVNKLRARAGPRAVRSRLRGARPGARPDRAPRHRLRPAPDRAAGRRGRAVRHGRSRSGGRMPGVGDGLSRRRHPVGGAGEGGGRHALSRRALRQARRPHASAQLHARPGARDRRGRRDDPRELGRASASTAATASGSPRPTARCAPGMPCWPAMRC